MTPAAQVPAPCPGCGIPGSEPAGPPPAEHSASATCYGLYGTLLARSYSDPGFRRVHQLIVDAYAAQHAGGTSRREIQTVALCLMTLELFMEHDVDPADGPRLHQRMVLNRPPFHWLQPPPQRHLLTVADVLVAADEAEHERLARRWAHEIWEAWAAHRVTIHQWNDFALRGPKGRSDRRRTERSAFDKSGLPAADITLMGGAVGRALIVLALLRLDRAMLLGRERRRAFSGL